MTNRIDHSTHDHEATREARAACRRTLAEGEVKVDELIRFFDREGMTIADWLMRGARRFGGYEGTDRREAAKSMIAYFAVDRGPGAHATDSPREMLSIILRSFS